MHFLFRNSLPGPPLRADIGSLQGIRTEGSSLATPRVKRIRNLAERVLPFPQQALPVSPVLHTPTYPRAEKTALTVRRVAAMWLVNLGCAQTDQHQRTCFYATVSVLCAEIPQLTTLCVSALMELTFQKRNRRGKFPQKWGIQHWAPSSATFLLQRESPCHALLWLTLWVS